MSAYLWLISEMLLLVTIAAAIFFVMGWRWQGQRARARVSALERQLDTEIGMAKLAREERDAFIRRQSTSEAIAAELQEAEARQQVLQREMLRLRDEKREAEQALERELRSAASNEVPPPVVPQAPATVVERENVEADDLTRIRGVGSVLSRKLVAAGVTSYRQLVEMSPDESAALDAKLALRGRMQRDDWQGQARVLLEKTSGGLKS